MFLEKHQNIKLLEDCYDPSRDFEEECCRETELLLLLLLWEGLEMGGRTKPEASEPPWVSASASTRTRLVLLFHVPTLMFLSGFSALTASLLGLRVAAGPGGGRGV